MKRFLAILLLAVLAVSLFVSCNNSTDVKGISSDDLVGTWLYVDDNADSITFSFYSDKSVKLEEIKDENTNEWSDVVTFAVSDSTVTISASKGEEKFEWKYDVAFKDGQLVLKQVGESTWLKHFTLKEITLDRSYLVSFFVDDNLSSTQTVKSGEKAEFPTVPEKTGSFFFGWTTDEEGKNSYDFDKTVTADVMLYANWKESFELGDRGPAGGYIFYKNPNASTDGWTYLEAASEDLANDYAWGPNGSYGTETAIGKGKSNTDTLVAKKKANSTLSFPAAEECDKYTGGWYEDWFLPSFEELEEMYKNLKLKSKGGNWDGDYYWSSSEKDSEGNNLAYMQSFGDYESYSNVQARSEVRPVRPCRAF